MSDFLKNSGLKSTTYELMGAMTVALSVYTDGEFVRTIVPGTDSDNKTYTATRAGLQVAAATETGKREITIDGASADCALTTC